jgi:hypothetical protein
MYKHTRRTSNYESSYLATKFNDVISGKNGLLFKIIPSVDY